MPSTFPVLIGWSDRRLLEDNGHQDIPRGIPWAMAEEARSKIERNHGQSLERLAERGGLSPEELVLGLQGLSLFGSRADVVMADPVRAYVSLKARLVVWRMRTGEKA